MNGNAALALELDNMVSEMDYLDEDFEIELDMSDEPDVAFYVSTPESNHQIYKHVGTFPISDEEYWLGEYQKQHGVDAKVMTLPFFEAAMVDANGTPVTA